MDSNSHSDGLHDRKGGSSNGTGGDGENDGNGELRARLSSLSTGLTLDRGVGKPDCQAQEKQHQSLPSNAMPVASRLGNPLLITSANENTAPSSAAASLRRASANVGKATLEKARHAFLTFGKFVGPGFMISVAYSEQTCQPPQPYSLPSHFFPQTDPMIVV